jgi:hypothetical protein
MAGCRLTGISKVNTDEFSRSHPMKAKSVVGLLFLLVLLPVSSLFATTFVMPTDDEMIDRAQRIVVGTIQSSYVRERNGSIETAYDLRIERTLKGFEAARGTSLEIVSEGGIMENRGLLVHSAAHFANGDKVLLFIVEEHGQWTTVDMTLGKFRFVTSTKGERLLTRDLDDIVAWERDGTPHQEKVRREEPFLRFIREHVADKRLTADDANYLVDASSVILPPSPESRFQIRAEDTYGPQTYSSFVTCPSPFCIPPVGPLPTRWDTFPATAVTYHKKNNTDIPGAGDGGVSAIQNGLAAWTNDCGSNVSLVYGGTTTTPATDFDTTHVVEFNDPQGRIGGTFPGTSSTVAKTFLSFVGTHEALSQEWWTISDADIVFNDGYTAASASFATAMTHELGHALGFRHSNATPASGNDQTVTCSAATEECTPTNTAIMFFQAGTTFNFTLQPFDVNAVRGIYPSNCVVVGPPTNVVAAATSGTSVQISWTAAAGATGYKVYRSTNNSAFTVVGTPAASPFTDNTASADTAYMYKVTSTDGVTESGFSNSDFATTVVFTDSIAVNTTLIKAIHITQLRTAVNALRTLNGGQGAFGFTDAALASVNIKAVHMNELRTQLNNVRTALGASTLSFTDTVTAGTTLVKKVHVDELRAGVQ